MCCPHTQPLHEETSLNQAIVRVTTSFLVYSIISHSSPFSGVAPTGFVAQYDGVKRSDGETLAIGTPLHRRDCVAQSPALVHASPEAIPHLPARIESLLLSVLFGGVRQQEIARGVVVC